VGGTVAGLALPGPGLGSPDLLAVAAGAAHLAAAAVWLGGAAVLAFTASDDGSPGGPTDRAGVVARAGRVVVASVLVVGVAGLASAVTAVDGPGALFGTSYGRVLVVKAVLVLLLALAAVRARTRALGLAVPSPSGASPAPGAPSGGARLGRVLRVEVVGLTLVVALSAVLAGQDPDRGAEPDASRTTATLGGGTVEVVVDPPAAGSNSLTLVFRDEAGRPLDSPDEAVTAGGEDGILWRYRSTRVRRSRASPPARVIGSTRRSCHGSSAIPASSALGLSQCGAGGSSRVSSVSPAWSKPEQRSWRAA